MHVARCTYVCVAFGRCLLPVPTKMYEKKKKKKMENASRNEQKIGTKTTTPSREQYYHVPRVAHINYFKIQFTCYSHSMMCHLLFVSTVFYYDYYMATHTGYVLRCEAIRRRRDAKCQKKQQQQRTNRKLPLLVLDARGSMMLVRSGITQTSPTYTVRCVGSNVAHSTESNMDHESRNGSKTHQKVVDAIECALLYIAVNSTVGQDTKTKTSTTKRRSKNRRFVRIPFVPATTVETIEKMEIA